MNQRQILISFFKSGKLQKLVTREILKTLPDEDRKRFKKEGIPEEIKDAVDAEINKQLLEAGIDIKELK